jgi:hypothetical protein
MPQRGLIPGGLVTSQAIVAGMRYRCPVFGDFEPSNGSYHQFFAFVFDQFNFMVLSNAATLLF